jgi:single-stranded DNA-binding protein
MRHNLNSLLLEGSLTSTPILSTAPDGIALCRFSVDVDDAPTPIPILAQGRLAVRCSELLDRGSTVRLVGRIGHDILTTASTGSFALAVFVDHVEVQPANTARHSEVA